MALVCAAIIGLSEAGFNPSSIASTLKIARTTVYRTLKKNDGTKKPLEYDSTSRTKRKLTLRVAAGLKRRIKAAPTKSLWRVATVVGQNWELVRRLVRISGWRSLSRTKVPLVSEDGQKKREIRARGLLNSLKEGGHPGRIIFFSDEKNFVVDPAFNPQNDRYICFYEDLSVKLSVKCYISDCRLCS